MKNVRIASIVFLIVVALASFLGGLLVPSGYAHQFRDLPNAAASRRHLLGTDPLGRDRLARVLYGTRVSLLLAPASALLATALAGLIGCAAGLVGGWWEGVMTSGIDLFLSLPWIFLLIAVRALMPLNVSPWTSVTITFVLLGGLGWPAAARVVWADTRALRHSDSILLARALGSSGFRLLRRQVLPQVMPVLRAQFWISVPVYILAEANLGILGLGVSEPLPSWGSLLRELESYSTVSSSAWQFVPLALFMAVIGCFQFLVLDRELLV
jgi:ABC-type dipeptide/oligopeptide/nickel transport system permease subunit